MIKKILPLFFIFVSACGNPSEETTNMNILEIVGKKPGEIEAIFGNPIKSETFNDRKANCKDCPKLTYNNGVEIAYINGIADWITIYPKEARFENCSIDLLGAFDCANRNFKSDMAMRWYNLKGIKEISFFRKYNGGQETIDIDYMYIKAYTE